MSEEKTRTLEKLDQEVFFAPEKPKPDFDFWSKAPYWKLQEARRLFLNLCPSHEYNLPKGFHPRLSPLNIRSLKLEELLTRARIYKEIKAKDTPLNFILWAQQKQIKIPKDLEIRVLELSGENNPILEKSFDTRERETLLKMIITMAIDGYGYDPKALKSAIPKEIEGALDRQGFSVSVDTIRDKLKEAKHLIPTIED